MTKRLFLSLIFAVALFSTPLSVQATPMLQLDLKGGTYDLNEESVVATGPTTLYALLTEVFNAYGGIKYYISVALAPQTSSSGDLGSFDFDGTTVQVTGGMTLGNPPIASIPSLDLPSHGVFPTYYWEYSFQFDPAKTVGTYNVQVNPGRFDVYSSGTGSYYMAFDVIPNLPEGYGLHFDLYSKTWNDKKGAWDVEYFAPFSHDATVRMPEPGTLLLLGSGLIGLVGFRRRSRKS
jgi:hypothetical protein